MDIRHLEYFVTVAQLKSFTRAAAALHITQPSISKMVKCLEDELGVLLLHRSGKETELTDAGKAVYNQAQQVLFSFRNLTSELSDVINIEKGSLRIGIPPIVGASFFPGVIGGFRETYPGIAIELVEAGSKTIEKGIEDGTLDIGIICTLPPKNGCFDLLPFARDPLMVIVHTEHRLANRANIELEDLREEAFVLYREDFSLHDRIIERCLRHGFRPNIILESSQRDFMAEMVAAKLGIALFPQKICRELDSTRIKAIPFATPDLFLHLAVIWKKDRYQSFAAREWLSYARQHLEKSQQTREDAVCEEIR